MKKIFLKFITIICISLLFSTNVYAASHFDGVLENGKLIIPSIRPTTDEEATTLITEYYFIDKGMDFYSVDGEHDAEGNQWALACNEDYSKCRLKYDDMNGDVETKVVDIEYRYDQNIKKIVDTYTKKLKDEEQFYQIKDMELVNFWNNSEDVDNIDQYSTELKEIFDYSNFTFFVDNRAGDSCKFYEMRLGIASIRYEGTIYYVNESLGTRANYILYVPSDTENTDEALIKAVQKRIDDYIGSGKFEISNGGNVNEWLTSYIRESYEFDKTWDQSVKNMNFEDYYNKKLEYYKDENDNMNFVYKNMNEKYFVATHKQSGRSFYFIVKRDSNSMFNPTYNSLDIKTNIKISSKDSSVPLDSIINSIKITDGEEYEKIIKTLNVKNSNTYDINVYSKSLNNNITKINNDKFFVELPISSELNGKQLIVYYVTKENKIEEHEVTIKDGYATFETDHFSIYTLAEKNSTNESNDSILNNNDNIKVPQTSDGITKWFVIELISVALLSIIIIFRKTIIK